jgi:hypothetical protein
MKIEKGVPIPTEGQGACKEKYSFIETMEVGDSFLMTEKERNNLYSYFSSRRTVPHYKFISRTLENGTLRVWLKEKPEMEEK